MFRSNGTISTWNVVAQCAADPCSLRLLVLRPNGGSFDVVAKLPAETLDRGPEVYTFDGYDQPVQPGDQAAVETMGAQLGVAHVSNASAGSVAGPLGSATSVTLGTNADTLYMFNTDFEDLTAPLPTSVTTLTASPNPVTGQTVTFTTSVGDRANASAGPPTGTVTVTDGAGALGDCQDVPLVNGSAACTGTFTWEGGHCSWRPTRATRPTRRRRTRRRRS